jgi:hypothetical protein
VLVGRNKKTTALTMVVAEPTGRRVSAATRIFLSSGLMLVVLLSAILKTNPAIALPSFAIQTGQPCAACHIGAFGPQLTPYGRDFKLHGYVASDGKDHGLPLAWTLQSSFTHTWAPQPGGAAPGFKPNDNVALDQTSVYWAGRITPEVGAFIEFMYDGVNQQPQVGNVDIRHASEAELFDHDLLWGVTFNNSPTVQDPWNSTPAWGFPYNRSPLAPTPMAATLVDGGLAQRVLGAGGYVLWNDLLYLESDLYKGLDTNALQAVGQVPVDGNDQTTAFMPYLRLAVIRDWEKHHLEIGAYGISANVLPGGNQTLGIYNRMTDVALDATYQFISDPTQVISDRLSAHATYIHETATMAATEAQALTGMLLDHSLDTMRVDVSYSFSATVTPSVQYFRTTGTTDVNYWSTLNGSPNSDGMILEVAYVPWGKPDSPFPNMNVRLAAQYVNYFSFDGSSTNARSNNNFYFSLWTAVKF